MSMKLLRSLFTLAIVAAAGIALVTMCPTEDDFAAYYVSQNQTGLGGFFDGAKETLVKQRTETKNFWVFAVFEVDGKERYIGILDHFFGSPQEHSGV